MEWKRSLLPHLLKTCWYLLGFTLGLAGVNTVNTLPSGGVAFCDILLPIYGAGNILLSWLCTNYFNLCLCLCYLIDFFATDSLTGCGQLAARTWSWCVYGLPGSVQKGHSFSVLCRVFSTTKQLFIFHRQLFGYSTTIYQVQMLIRYESLLWLMRRHGSAKMYRADMF